jgi:hypothetical protein
MVANLALPVPKTLSLAEASTIGVGAYVSTDPPE